MTRRSLEGASREELLRELEKLELAAERRAAAGEVPDRERLLHDLEVHQVELEMQNRELREAQERIEEARERYADLYDFAPVGYCTLDPEGRIMELNLRAAALLGGPRGELVGRPAAGLLPLESRPLFADHMARCRRSRGPVTSELTLARGPGGARTVHVVSEPIMHHAGEAIAFRTSLVDVSERKRLELELRLLARAGQVLGATLDPVRTLETAAQLAVPALADLCIIDVLVEGGAIERPVVVLADPARGALAERLRERPGPGSAQVRVIESREPILLAEVSEEVRGHLTIDERHGEALRAAAVESALIVPLAVRGRSLGALTLASCGSGRRFTAAHLELVGDLASRVALAMDTARLYVDAQRAIEARDATLSLVSHDLRTPLGVIMMRTDLFESHPAIQAWPEGVTGIASIRRAAQQMSRLIQDLLDVSSIEAGRFSVERSPQQLATLIGGAVDALRAQAAAKGLRLEQVLPTGERLDVDCDRDRLEQVLANLIGNAIKFTAAGGVIRVTAAERGAEVWCAVSDTGSGMAPADLPHIFDRHWQARETARLGSGLGLAIARGIVEAHGGRIWVESQLGVGSTFHVALPRAAASGAVPGPLVAAAPPPAAQAGGLILVIDDDADAREVLGDVLERGGYEVAYASDGDQALAYLGRAPPPALMVLDLGMAVMDGWEFLSERERDPALRAIPVLVMSGQRDVASRIGAFHAGYLPKPAQAARLREEVARLARRVR